LRKKAWRPFPQTRCPRRNQRRRTSAQRRFRAKPLAGYCEPTTPCYRPCSPPRNSPAPDSKTETGESEDSIEIAYDGDPLTIGFNAQYLIEFIKASGAAEVKLELKDAQSAGQFRPAEGEDYKYRYIVMPMRI
jgi:hypothetical protein